MATSKAQTPQTETKDTAPAAGPKGVGDDKAQTPQTETPRRPAEGYDLKQLRIPQGMPDAIVDEVLELAAEADASLAGVQKMLDKRATQPMAATPRMVEYHRPDVPMVRFVGSVRVKARQVKLHPVVGPDGKVTYSPSLVYVGDVFPWYGDPEKIPQDCERLTTAQERALGTSPSRAEADRVMGPLESGAKQPVLPTGPKKPKATSPV